MTVNEFVLTLPLEKQKHVKKHTEKHVLLEKVMENGNDMWLAALLGINRAEIEETVDNSKRKYKI